MDRTSQLAPLGLHRLRLLDCLGGNTPRSSGYFNIASGTDVLAGFREHIRRISTEWEAKESVPLGLALLAAGRLLTGDLNAAKVILDLLPARPFKVDHGAGYCVITPQLSLRASMPLPKELTDINRWLAGSDDQAALRKWLNENRDRLDWDENKGVYQSRPLS